MRLKTIATTGDTAATMLARLMQRVMGSGATLEVEAGTLLPTVVIVAANDYRVTYRNRSLRFTLTGNTLSMSEEIEGVASTAVAQSTITTTASSGYLEFVFTEELLAIGGGSGASAPNFIWVFDLPAVGQYASGVSKNAIFTGAGFSEVQTKQHAGTGSSTPVMGLGNNTISSPTFLSTAFYSPTLGAAAVTTGVVMLSTAHGAVKVFESIRRLVNSTGVYGDSYTIGSDTFDVVSSTHAIRRT